MNQFWKRVMAGGTALAGGAAVWVSAQTPTPPNDGITPEVAREKIVESNRLWSKARLSYDRAHMEASLSSDFYVQIGDRKMTRQEFIGQCATQLPNAKLVRFDVDVLTVQRKREGGWVAVVSEKLEIERTGPDGKVTKTYSFWITRDSYRETNGKWLCTSSEASGFESWQGKKPPFPNW